MPVRGLAGHTPHQQRRVLVPKHDKIRLDKNRLDENRLVQTTTTNNLYEIVEKNFGRPLSPIEIEKINDENEIKIIRKLYL